MVRKIKTSEVNIENVSYDAVVETVSKVDEASVEEPTKPELVSDVGGQVKQEELVGNVADLPPDVGHHVESVEDVKKQNKESEKGTCERCGKTMTLKNLRYAHSKVCSDSKDEIKEDIPKPALYRTVSECTPEEVKTPKRTPKPKTVKVLQAEEVVEVPAVQKKPKQIRSKKVPEPAVVSPSEPVVMKKSRAVLKAEKYTALAANALP